MFFYTGNIHWANLISHSSLSTMILFEQLSSFNAILALVWQQHSGSLYPSLFLSSPPFRFPAFFSVVCFSHIRSLWIKKVDGSAQKPRGRPQQPFWYPWQTFWILQALQAPSKCPGAARPVCKKIFIQAFYVKILILFVLSTLCYIIKIPAMTQRDNINNQLFPTLLISVGQCYSAVLTVSWQG